MSDATVVRVALVQDAPVAFDLDASLHKTQTLIAAAAAGGAQLIVFPEAFLSGYPKRADFGVRVGLRSAAGRDWFARYFDSAVELGGRHLRELSNIVRQHRVHVVLGVIERVGSTLYCSAITMDSQGDIVGLRRKLMPTAMERVIWGQGDGSTLQVSSSQLGRIGVAICWENYMPLLRTCLYQQGVELYCAPTVDDRATWAATMQHVALEGRCFVLSVCQFAQWSDFPADYSELTTESPLESAEPLIRGGSCLVSPLGQFLIPPVFDRAEILWGECDMRDIPRARFDFDPVGHYARPDVFQLQIQGHPPQRPLLDEPSVRTEGK